MSSALGDFMEHGFDDLEDGEAQGKQTKGQKKKKVGAAKKRKNEAVEESDEEEAEHAVKPTSLPGLKRKQGRPSSCQSHSPLPLTLFQASPNRQRTRHSSSA